MSDTSLICIDLSSVDHNMRVLRRIVGPNCAVCPIVKADGYGLGVAPIARRLVAAGADMLAVYTPQQAAELARAAVGGPILILMPVREIARGDEAYRLMINGRLHLTVHDNDHLDDLLHLAEHFATLIPVHVDVDTGMSRGGCQPDETPLVVKRIAGSRWLHLAGLSTHFAQADADAGLTKKQLAVFDALVQKCAPLMPPDCLIHAANTFATFTHRRFHKSMVRVGQAWAGYGSQWINAGQFRRKAEELRPIITWRSHLVQVKTIKRGTSVGYGSTWTAKRRSRIGLVPVGYADGYSTGLGSTDANPKPACVGVVMDPPPAKGAAVRFVPVVGQVNMDQITIDLTELIPSGGGDSAQIGPGTTVELISPDPAAPNHLPALAKAAGTIPHELLCRLNPRIKRVYDADLIPQPTAPAAVLAG